MKESSQGIQFTVVLILSLSLMFFDYQSSYISKTRGYLSSIFYPLEYLIDTPSRLLSNFGSYFVSKSDVIAQNNNLKEKQLLLEGKLQKMISLEAENVRLRELLNSSPYPGENLIVTEILNVDPDPFTHKITLDKGSIDKVYIGQPVIDAKGIMGSIIEITPFSSKALLITDASHSIPVESTRNGVRSIASGTGTKDSLQLLHVPNTTDLNEGDIFVSSGLGGKYPVGYPVGVIEKIERDYGKPFAKIILKPLAQLSRNRQVLLVEIKENEVD